MNSTAIHPAPSVAGFHGREFENLRLEHEALRLRSKSQLAKITDLEGEVLWLKEQIAELRREKFGKKSERWESQEQGCLFNEAEVESQKPDEDVEADDLRSVKIVERGRLFD